MFDPSKESLDPYQSLITFGLFHSIRVPVLKEFDHHSRPSPMRPNEVWTRTDTEATRAKAPGCQRGSCRSVRREQERIRLASDVVKVDGRNPATPCSVRGEF